MLVAAFSVRVKLPTNPPVNAPKSYAVLVDDPRVSLPVTTKAVGTELFVLPAANWNVVVPGPVASLTVFEGEVNDVPVIAPVEDSDRLIVLKPVGRKFAIAPSDVPFTLFTNVAGSLGKVTVAVVADVLVTTKLPTPPSRLVT
jgi:hypothetical protein